MSGFCQKKPKIDYPCPWLFKVIGFDRNEMEEAIGEVVGDVPFSVTASMSSSSGKYQSVNLETEVASEKDRDRIYQELSSHRSVKVVL